MPWLSRGAAAFVLISLAGAPVGALACNGRDDTRLLPPPEARGVALRKTPLGVTSYIDRPDTSEARAQAAVASSAAPAPAGSTTDRARSRVVVLVSVDGLAPYVLASVRAPTLERLAREGISYENARTVVPSITLTSHVSMLSGVPPEEHKVLWNYYDADQKIRTPTVFTRCRAHGLRCGIFAGKEKFLHFAEIEPGVQRYEYQPSAREVIAQASRYITDKRPDFVFIHLAEVDATGHEHGWNSKPQRAAIERIDAELGLLVAAIQSQARPAALIITADHGGHGRVHDHDIPQDRRIPWIGFGDGIQKLGVTSHARAVSTMDTAATVLELLGVPVPLGLSGHAVALAPPSP